MAVFGTSDAAVLMPRNIADGMITNARTSSVIARLSGREPMRFGETDFITFSDFPKAEFVEEGANKSSTTGAFGSVTAVPHKAQVTMRFNEEVQWADEDYQLGVLRTLGESGQIALSRALDLGLIHRINPLTGTVITAWTNYIAATTNNVEIASADADTDFRTAVGLLINSAPTVQVNGAAFDPRFSWSLANLFEEDGTGATTRLRYPQLGFGTDVSNFMGVNVAQGDTVSGTPEASDTGVRAILGDFQNGIRWGVQRDLPVELIRYGDPDGQGDLKRTNQIALRLEIVYGWYVFPARFAMVIDAPGAWAAGTEYAVGDRRTVSGATLEVTVAGESHATTAPTAPGAVGGTVVDNEVTWKRIV